MRLLAFFVLLVQALALQAAELRCAGSAVTVHAEAGAGEVRAACAAVDRARVFLASVGVDTSGAFDVHVVDALPTHCGMHSYACYAHRDRSVAVLARGACRALTWPTGEPLGEAGCAGLVVHEVAHAFVDEPLRAARPRLLAHEYLAYVAMLATMPEEAREALLARYPGTGFASHTEMSIDYYLLDPMRFAAQAYRHFLKPGCGRDFIRAVLAGEVLKG